MLDEETVQIRAQLLALEHFLTSFVAVEMSATGWGEQQVKDLVETFTSQAQTSVFPGRSATESDLLASEFEAAMKSLLALLLTKRRLVQDSLEPPTAGN